MYNCTHVGYRLARYSIYGTRPRARARSVRRRASKAPGVRIRAEGLQGAHGRGTLFASWWARMDWKKFENFFVRDSPTVSGLTVGI